MRIALITLVAALPLAACSHTATSMVEADGMPRGALAVAAIDRGDLGKAERLLADSPLNADNPARLINLGYVYMRQGRNEDAVRAWREVLASDGQMHVVTLDGREVTTDRLAREALARYGNRRVASR
jgi:Flp pilus assembly protein TadD